MNLKSLFDIDFKLVKVAQAGNIFSGGKITCLLKPVNRDYQGTTKKPVYYLSVIENGLSQYLSGLFATGDDMVFSADYKDSLGVKHIVRIAFADGGKALTIVPMVRN
ncbi:MAG: hypothetical protein NTV00_07865 [Methylococcales bacterium]|nr:hypothetical protein [Methylococcales bacterium]